MQSEVLSWVAVLVVIVLALAVCSFIVIVVLNMIKHYVDHEFTWFSKSKKSKDNDK